MAVAMAVAGTIGWFVVVSGQPVLNVVFWRCVFGAATLLVVCASKGFLRAISLRVFVLSTLGGIAIVVNWILLFAAYSRASISIATAVYNVQPFILVCFGAIFLAERLTIAKLAWLCLAFVGLLLVVQLDEGAGRAGGSFFVGVLMAFGAAFTWAVAALIAKQLKGTPPHLIALIQMCVGTLLLAPIAGISHVPASLNTWGLLVVIGVVHTGFVYVLMYGAVHKLPTHAQGVLSFIYPIVAIAVDVVAFGHRLVFAQIIGVAAILLAVAGMHKYGGAPTLRPRTAPAHNPRPCSESPCK
ncbi:DMT family transporter [Dyella mobilis]|nr:DMT family transporter [Dyella mobilis]